MSEERDAQALAARRMMRSREQATLATLSRDPQPWPHPSFTLVAFDHDGSPLVFISDLAEHTRNIRADDRVSLLFSATEGLENPLTGTRLSVRGRAAASDDPGLLARFLNRHPCAAMLTQLGDFGVFKVTVSDAYLVAGFGRARWLTASALMDGGAPAVVAGGGSITDVENEILSEFSGRDITSPDRPGGPWRLIGVDPDGCDLRHGIHLARADFPVPDPDPRRWRDAVAALLDG